MSDPYVGEIRMFGGNFAPVGWAFCDGQLIAISENETLFQLIGTTYGGDGQTTYALPDLRGRVPIHQGQGPGLTPRTIGDRGGVESVTLIAANLPPHIHAAPVRDGGAGTTHPQGAYPAGNNADPAYGGAAGAMNPAAVSFAGSNQPHDNMQPYTCVNFIISLFGIFPSPS